MFCRAKWQVAAGLLALLWCLAPALFALHSTHGLHRYCAEHGVLEDVDAKDTASPKPDATRASIADTNDEASVHVPCAFTGLMRLAPLPGGPAWSTPPPRAPVSTECACSTEVGAPIALLLLAPKTSPPG